MQQNRPISEEELHAYVDGVIEPARRLEVAVYLAGHPMEAARVEAFRAQTEGIHALFDGVLEQPSPTRLRALLERHSARAARRRGCAWGLAAIAMALVLLGGRALSGFVAVHLHPGALVSGPAAEHQPADTQYPVIPPPGPAESRSRSIDI